MRKKKHTTAEIAAKLLQANDLVAQGKLQSDVARALGVSVMTLYRWRTALAKHPSASVAPTAPIPFAPELGPAGRIAELQLENSRLRRLVTDLLLEKMKLDEAAQVPKSPPHGTRRASR